MYLAQSHPAANQNRRLNQSSIDALIDLVIRSRLRCQIPVRLNNKFSPASALSDRRLTGVKEGYFYARV